VIGEFDDLLPCSFLEVSLLLVQLLLNEDGGKVEARRSAYKLLFSHHSGTL